MALSPTKAAAQWLAADASYRAASAQRDEAAVVLKAHFAAKGSTEFRGVRYSVSTYRQLDAALARSLLGAKAADAEVTRTRETLSAVPK